LPFGGTHAVSYLEFLERLILFHTVLPAFIHVGNEPYLPLPSQLKLSFVYPAEMEG